MEKILTIVIPTYNMQDYLRRCLDSLIVPEEQMKQLEVLVVNDGSKDNSSAIAHEYQDKYPGTFRVIDKENGNYGSCVNRGLKEANGKYIKILDADDWFDTIGFDLLIKDLDTIDVDLILTDYDVIDMAGNCENQRISFPKLNKHNVYDVDKSDVLSVISGFQMHSAVYSVDLLRKMNYKQTEGISYTDQEWIYYPLYKAQTIVYFDYVVYHYMVGRDGQTMDPKVLKKSIPHTLQGTKAMLSYYVLYNKNDLSAARCKYLAGKIEGRLLYLYRFCLLKSDSKTDLKLLEKLEKFVKQNSLEIYKKLQYALVSKKCPIPYVFYWRIVHKRLPSIFREI